jgi:hypothetical protein
MQVQVLGLRSKIRRRLMEGWMVVIVIVSIVGGLAIPISAIFLDFRRRQLQSQERLAMIERGMQPPAAEPDGNILLSPEQRREKSLQTGIICLGVGLGLGLAAWLLGFGIVNSCIPNRVAGPLAAGGAIVGFIGLANLLYYAVTRPRRAATRT